MLAYPLISKDIRVTNDDYAKHAVKTSHYEYLYMTYLQHKRYPDLLHAFNQPHPEPFERSIPDGYSPAARCLIYAHGCRGHGHWIKDANGHEWGCSYMPLGTTKGDRNMWGDLYGPLEARFEAMKRRILASYADRIDRINVNYQCQFEKELRTPGTPIYEFFHSSPYIPQTVPAIVFKMDTFNLFNLGKNGLRIAWKFQSFSNLTKSLKRNSKLSTNSHSINIVYQCQYWH